VSTKGFTLLFSVFYGVVPDSTFPGDLTFGKSVFHKWRLGFNGNVDLAQRKTARLRNFDNKFTLVLCDRVSKTYFAHTAAEARKSVGENAFLKRDAIAMRWGKGIPVTDPQIRAYLKSHVTNFPGFFDPAVRRTDVFCKIEHVIDTGDAEPVKLPPRRYSPAQLMAIRDFVETNLIIRKEIGP
jgi:hypothetical protein